MVNEATGDKISTTPSEDMQIESIKTLISSPIDLPTTNRAVNTWKRSEDTIEQQNGADHLLYIFEETKCKTYGGNFSFQPYYFSIKFFSSVVNVTASHLTDVIINYLDAQTFPQSISNYFCEKVCSVQVACESDWSLFSTYQTSIMFRRYPNKSWTNCNLQKAFASIPECTKVYQILPCSLPEYRTEKITSTDHLD